MRGAGGLSIPRPCLWAMSAMSDAEYTSATALSLVNVKVAMMIGMCIPLTRSLPEANWQEGHTMPERRAHEPVPEARARPATDRIVHGRKVEKF